MKKNVLYIIYFLLFSGLILVSGCKENNIHPDNEVVTGNKAVFIINEGNLGYGNASLSYYEPDSFGLHNDIFLSKNDFPVGDVPQSMVIKDSIAYIAVSNSGKILAFNISTFVHSATIGGLTAPRYILFINDSIMLVSDLYEKKMKIVNIIRNEITGNIPVGGPVEEMEIMNDYIYAASWSFNNKLYKISATEMCVVDSLATGLQPNSIVKDRNNKLWVLCDGGYPGNPAGHERARLMKIDPYSMTILKELRFPELSSSPSKLTVNNSRDTLYFIDGNWGGESSPAKGVFRMSVDETELPGAAVISGEGHLFYGLGVDPGNSDIYCSDAIDYLQKGIIFRYNADGEKVDSFRAGVVPGHFAFKH